MRFLLLSLLLAPTLAAQSLDGLWDATAEYRGMTVPFQMEFQTDGASVEASFFNGEERFTSTSGRFESGKLEVRFDHMLTRLEADWIDGRLKGTYYGSGPTGNLPFEAEPAKDETAGAASAPDISGEWRLAVNSSKGESAWRFLVRQDGAKVAATILRIDGDTGELAGRYQDGKYVLSHFSGARPALMVVERNDDGSLHLTMNGTTEYTAVRPETARAQGLAGPTDPEFHTGVKDPSERFRFSFPDLNGKMITNNDPRFEDKVVVVSILGSWCPNCHDEAPFLAELYRKYREQGLEIVGLSFEEEDQLADPSRLRAFVAKYGIEYPVLVCGMPEEATEKMPQLDNFNAWPTTLFLGRDGRVKMVHAGFPSVASGDVFEQTKSEIEAEVERLLAEN